MLNLGVAFYAMSGQYSRPNTLDWLSRGRGPKDCFMVGDKKKRILQASVENCTVLLPLDAPPEHCTPAFYQEHVRDSLVLLCCDMPGGEVATVAVGVCVGEELYANALDPALRYRGRRDAFDAPIPIDANHLLMPVHVLTTLMPEACPTPVTFATLLGAQPDLSPRFLDNRLPPQLQLLVVGVQAAMTTPLQPEGTPVHAQQLMALALNKALAAVLPKRKSAGAKDVDRPQLVDAAIRAMNGHTTPALPKHRRAKLAENKHRKAAQKLDRLLRECAKNVRDIMHLAYTDYDHLQLIADLVNTLAASV